MLPSNLKFSCSTLSSINGYTLKANEPDAEGCYEVIVGCLGIPTRQDVIYEPESVVEAMRDPTGRFNICLRDGNLPGEWGHPQVKSKEDLNRLLIIDETKISHYFRAIWIDAEKPIMINGQEAYAIRAKVKPAGPYGKYLEESLRDPCINTSFSIRSICTPSTGPDNRYSYRRVEYLVTFDAVFAPGYEITSKRYAIGGTESLELNVNVDELQHAINTNATAGLESVCMLSDANVRKLRNEKEYMINGRLVGTNILEDGTIVDTQGNFINAASLCYRHKQDFNYGFI